MFRYLSPRGLKSHSHAVEKQKASSFGGKQEQSNLLRNTKVDSRSVLHVRPTDKVRVSFLARARARRLNTGIKLGRSTPNKAPRCVI